MKKTLCFTFVVVLFITIYTGTAYAESEIKFIEQPFKDGRTYSIIYPFSEGRAVVRKGDFFTGKWGFIDENGDEVVPCIYDFALSFSEGLAPVMRGGKGGFINREGEVVIPFVYNSTSSFSEGLAVVTNEQDMRGYIDKNGNLVIPHHFTEAGSFSEGLAHVHGDYYNTPIGRGHIDKTGTIVTALDHEEVGPFSNGLAFYRKDYKYGFINKNDDIVIPAKYDEVHGFENGIAQVSLNDKWGIIDKGGETVLPFTYDYIYGFREGLGAVYKNGKKGFIDESGNLVIPLIYDDVGGFNEGLCVVAKRDANNKLKWGYIDKTGKELTPFVYDTASVVKDGLATVDDSALLRVFKGYAPVEEPVREKPKEIMALPNKLKVVIDGSEISIGSYLINNTSYFKLRDIAYALKSTTKRFDVVWSDYSNSIFLNPGNGYTPIGGEMKKITDIVRAVPSSSKLFINNNPQSLECYTIAGSNYFKLRDLGKHLMFDVEYNNEKKQIEINTKENLGVSLGDIKISLGDSLDSVIKKMGDPDRVDDNVTNLRWYVYNNDYSNFIMIGFYQDIVSAIYTSHTNFVVNDTIKYGEFEENLPSSDNVKYYIDVFGGRILYGVMLVEDPRIALWKNDIDKKDILSVYEYQEFDCLNAFRVFRSLNPLRLDEIALKSAREHSRNMAENNHFEHVGLDGRSHYNRYWDNDGKNFPYAENIAAGDTNGIDQFKGLLNSSDHRSNMMIPDANYVGIGVYYKEDSQYKFYGTQSFTKNN